MATEPRVLTEKELIEVEKLAKYLSKGQLADYLGIGRTTFYNIAERQPALDEHYKRGKAQAIGAIAKSLLTKAHEGDTTSMIFYLKTQAGWRETNKLDVTHSGSGVLIAPAEITEKAWEDAASGKK